MANTFKFGNGNWAVGKETVLAYNDQNNNFKPLPFSFTRNSTATYVDSDGLIKTAGQGEARIDYLDNADGHLLLEPARANLVANSNAPSSGGSRTTKSGTTIKFVDGVTDVQSDKSILASGTPYTYYNNITLETNTPYTFSVFVRKTESNPLSVNHVKIASTNRFPSNYTIFSLDSGTVVSTEHDNATITSFNDGWYRITVTEVSTSAGQGFNFIVYPAVDSSGTNADITAVGQEILYTNGFQIEEGSYATSYIPTEGSSVTRVAENIALTLPDVDSYNSSSGFSVISKFDIGAAGTGTSSPFLFFNDDTTNTYFGFGSNSTNLRCRLNLSGTAYLNTQQNAPRTQKNSLFVSCDSSGWSQGANGVTNFTGSNDASVFDKLYTILMTTNEIYGIIKITELLVYNTRLTDSELETLTT